MRNTNIISLFTAILLLVSGCGGGGGSTAPGPTTYSITGQVQADANGDGFQYAAVTVTATSSGAKVTTTTPSNGNYTVSGLANGDYTVTANRLVYSSASGTFALASIPTISVPVTDSDVAGANLTAQDLYRVHGTVLNSTGEPMPGVVITLTTTASFTDLSTVEGNDATFSTTSLPDGTYSIGGLSNNNYYSMTATFPGYGFSTVQTSQGATMSNFQIQGGDLLMNPAGTLTPSGGGVTVPISGS